MIKKLQWGWERLDENTMRAKVIGGWIIRCIGGLLKAEVVTVKEARNIPMSESMIFVSDPEHQWTIVQPKVDPLIERSTIAKDFG